MKEILLCKYGEIVLKGANKKYFEDVLCRELRIRAKSCGKFDIYRYQSTIYIEPLDEDADVDHMFDVACHVFGIITVSRCAVCEKTMEAITELVKSYIPPFLDGKKTFKVESRRSDKTFPLNSMQIAAEIGGVILADVRGLRVDVHNPEITVHVEIRERGAYVHAGTFHAAGGIPTGTSGKGLLLLSGGIDSPVAGYMMAKRGVRVEAVYFESVPYTSERARDKVLRLAGLVGKYAGNIHVHVISLTHIQEELVHKCEEDYFTLLLRRYMMAIADQIAKANDCGCLITGESLGQVASQTMAAIHVTNIMTNLPVFRPCIGMDKEEIVQTARAIKTFDTSIEPYEDCCTVFTPRHPRTKPELAKVEAEEKKLDFDALVKEAIGTEELVRVHVEF